MRTLPTTLKENVMWKRLNRNINLRLMSSTSTLAVLVAVVEAGRKWH